MKDQNAPVDMCYYMTRTILGGSRIVVSRTPGSSPSPLDLLLEQAIADDLHCNDGRMFGHETLKLFTALNSYPERWECVKRIDGGAILERTPSHPHQSVTRYRYEPSGKFGGNELRDRPVFFILETKERKR